MEWWNFIRNCFMRLGMVTSPKACRVSLSKLETQKSKQFPSGLRPKAWDAEEPMEHSSSRRTSRIELQEEPRFQLNPKAGKKPTSHLEGHQIRTVFSYSEEGQPLFYPSLQLIDWGPLTRWRANGCTQSANRNINLIPKHPHRNAQSNRPKVGAPHGTVTVKFNR